MKQYYECHITMEGDKELCKIAVHDIGWKFSCIDGDPVLGSGIKCYATKHFNTKIPEKTVLEILNNAATEIILTTDHKVEITRQKIEKVIFDDRSTKVKIGSCDGACPEYHLDDYKEAGLVKTS